MKAIIGISLLLLSMTASAADQACVIEGKFSILGKEDHSKECMSDPTVSEAQFKATCEGVANSFAQAGGARGTVEYMAHCPLLAKGVCKGVLGSKRDTYYYLSSDLNRLPASCKKGGGVWSSGN